jgi:MFS family permease
MEAENNESIESTNARSISYMIPVLGSFFGWLMDGYVTIAYLIQESTIVPLFFPGSLYIVYFFIFVVNGIARAIGAIFLGNFIGDKLGRQRMLVITILIFSLTSFALGFLPTYAHIGALAPLTMGVLLFFMGLFAGAEYGGGTALSMESVPRNKRNLLGAFVQSGFGVGYALVAFVFFILTDIFGSSYSNIGWRILFFTTIIPGLSTFVIRFKVHESSVFEKAKKNKELLQKPVFSLFRQSLIPLLIVVAIAGSLLFVNTATFSLYPTIFESVDDFSRPTTGFWIAIINLVSIGGVVLGGVIASRSLKKLIFMKIYVIAFIIVSVFADLFAFTTNLSAVVLAFSAQVFVEAMIFSTLPAFMAESFSKKYRTTGVGFSYNLGSTIGSVALLLIPYYAAVYGWAYYWILAVLASSFVLLAGIFIAGYATAGEQKQVDYITQ